MTGIIKVVGFKRMIMTLGMNVGIAMRVRMRIVVEAVMVVTICTLLHTALLLNLSPFF